MMQKSKSKTNSLAELHFVSSLQLEESVMLIGDMEDDYYQVMLTEVSPDEFMFYIDYLPENTKVAEVTGTMQRWNGTKTKIDADGKELNLEPIREEQDITLPLIIIIILISIGSNLAMAIGQDWLVILVIFGVIGGALYLNRRGEAKKAQKVIFKHRDYLLQGLIDRFKSAGDVETL